MLSLGSPRPNLRRRLWLAVWICSVVRAIKWFAPLPGGKDSTGRRLSRVTSRFYNSGHGGRKRLRSNLGIDNFKECLDKTARWRVRLPIIFRSLLGIMGKAFTGERLVEARKLYYGSVHMRLEARPGFRVAGPQSLLRSICKIIKPICEVGNRIHGAPVGPP
jgi:hypothetical protein